MKAARPYPRITITPKGERALTGGHPWVYEGEVLELSDPVEDGALVDVVSRKGSWLGCGFYNSASKIRVRVVTRNANDDPSGDAFWARRLRYAWDYRKAVMGETDSRCCRLIFGEADGFPGLTVDRFESVLVAQVLSLGMERLKARLFPLLADMLRQDGQDIRGIYERNDAALREREGMTQSKGWFPLPGETPPERTDVDITENGVVYTVDFENGQKTGFFLDQKYNRLAVAKLARGRTVLDCFTHTGSFALNAARGGAARVTAVDVSEFAVECARENAARNGVAERIHFHRRDLLTEEIDGVYDAILSNPPYIRDDVLPTLAPELAFEPRIALAGGRDGMDFYRAILTLGAGHLAPGGFFLFEIGYDQKQAILDLAAAHGYRAEVTDDLGGNPRCACLQTTD